MNVCVEGMKGSDISREHRDHSVRPQRAIWKKEDFKPLQSLPVESEEFGKMLGKLMDKNIEEFDQSFKKGSDKKTHQTLA